MSGPLLQFSLSLLAAVLAGAALRLAQAPRRVLIVGTVLTACLTLFGTLWAARRPGPSLEVAILSPPSGAELSEQALVEGKVAAPRAEVYVVVHPLETEHWWVQSRPLVQRDGRWQVQVQLGTSIAGKGEQFEILALATDESRFEQLLRGESFATGQEIDSISPYLAQSNLVTVRRRL
jgi:hypothetical protein